MAPDPTPLPLGSACDILLNVCEAGYCSAEGRCESPTGQGGECQFNEECTGELACVEGTCQVDTYCDGL